MQEKNHRLLQVSLEILTTIADSGEQVSFKEITTWFSLPKSTLHNLVQTLCNTGYLEKNEETGKYAIGISCFQTGMAFRKANPFKKQARKIVENVSLSCNETTHFAVLERTDVVYIYKYDSTQSIRVYSEVGRKVPAHATAIGKALLSGYTDDQVRALYPSEELPALTAHSITSLDILLEQLREIRRNSIAFEHEESSPYVKCIAVPVLNSKGFPAAALSLALPIYREDANTQKLIQLLMDAKKELEQLYALYE